MTTSSSKKSYFDLHVTGLGYVNRIREVKPPKGDSFLCCSIAALNGSSDKPDKTFFDVRVYGKDAQQLIKRCEEAVKANRKVLMGFRLGDLWIDRFEYPETHPNPEKAGKPGVSLKARLLFISWIKVDGQMEYKAPKAAEEAAPDEANDSAVDTSVSKRSTNGAAAPAEAPASAASI